MTDDNTQPQRRHMSEAAVATSPNRKRRCRVSADTGESRLGSWHKSPSACQHSAFCHKTQPLFAQRNSASLQLFREGLGRRKFCLFYCLLIQGPKVRPGGRATACSWFSPLFIHFFYFFPDNTHHWWFHRGVVHRHKLKSGQMTEN